MAALRTMGCCGICFQPVPQPLDLSGRNSGKGGHLLFPGPGDGPDAECKEKEAFLNAFKQQKAARILSPLFLLFAGSPAVNAIFPAGSTALGTPALPLSGDPLRPPIMGLPASPLSRGRRPDRPRPFRAGRPACSPSRRLGRGFFIGKPGSPSAKSVSASRPLPFLFGDKTADKGTAPPPNGQDSFSASASSRPFRMQESFAVWHSECSIAKGGGRQAGPFLEGADKMRLAVEACRIGDLLN